MDKQQILIVDDGEVNRAILKEMFRGEEETYDLLEAENGQEAISLIERKENIVLILLDIIMPVMDGFQVLEYMHEHELLEKIPVILVTSEAALDSEEKAYSYGVADVIHKPFYPHIVKKRSKNIIALYQSKQDMQKRLKEQEEELMEQHNKIRRNNEFMIDALSSVVEFRSAETGEHTRRIKYFTRIMLKYLMQYFPKYGVTQTQVDEIARASAMHDIGKIAIPDAILLKPGRLTADEFEVMKTHTTLGCDILEKAYRDKSSTFYQYCYEICRHHHERWDGNGYPDHLEGDDIPLSAQIVAVADVYDALVSPRVYKSAYANNQAYDMIMNGECGQFAPDVLECFALAKVDFFNIVEVIKMFDYGEQ
ncbi:MAG: response regulator [Lachnospiraceae bacterium]|nr:response regulator [Lachnospiraceae bacterium]MDE6625738.1 response regulator [Lachnospiraceae bacterium]